jgi:hypothetical protein
MHHAACTMRHAHTMHHAACTMGSAAITAGLTVPEAAPAASQDAHQAPGVLTCSGNHSERAGHEQQQTAPAGAAPAAAADAPAHPAQQQPPGAALLQQQHQEQAAAPTAAAAGVPLIAAQLAAPVAQTAAGQSEIHLAPNAQLQVGRFLQMSRTMRNLLGLSHNPRHLRQVTGVRSRRA